MILLIEDSLADATLVREALEEHGVEGKLLILGDGDRAIRFIQTLDMRAGSCPDLMIVDLNLPRRSGRDVLLAIRQSTTCRNARVVILSSSDRQQDRADAMALGANRYFRKPLRLEDFLALGAKFKTMLGG